MTLVVACGIVLVLRRPAERQPLLVVAAGLTMWDASPVTLFGSQVRIYQMAAPVILAAAIAAVPRDGLHRAGLLMRDRRVLVLAASSVAFTVLTAASLAWTISLSDTVVVSVGQVSLLALCLTYVLVLAAGVVRAEQLLVSVAIVSAAGSCLAMAQFLLSLIGVDWRVLQGTSGVPWGRPAGLMTEPDWCALSAVLGAVIAMWLWIRAQRRIWLALAALDALVIILTAARAVWLACLLSLIAWLVTRGRSLITMRRMVLGVVGLVSVTGLILLMNPSFVGRLNPWLLLGQNAQSDGGSAHSRVGVIKLIADEGSRYLPWGAGAGSLNALSADPANIEKYVGGGELNAGRGSTNLFATAWFDLGALGLLVMLVFVAAALMVAWKRRYDAGLSLILLTVLLVDFQFNNGLRFGFVWLLLSVHLAPCNRLTAHDSGGAVLFDESPHRGLVAS